MPILLLVVALLVLAAPAQAKGLPEVGCDQHIEGEGPIAADRTRDVVRGPLALLGGRVVQRHRMPMGRGQMRLGVLLAAGHRATVEVAPESREDVALQHRLEGSGRPPEVSLDFIPCDPSTRRFGGDGTVGAATAWGGGLLVRERTCARLLVWVDEERLPDVRLPLGRPCRPPAAMRTVGCRSQSLAGFPGAFSDRRNLTIGPVTLVGGAEAGWTASAATIRELGWWKAPLLLREGATAVVSVAWEARRLARVGWGPAPEGRALHLRACGQGDAGSRVDDTPVTFWSGGFTVSRVPACVPLDVWIGLEPARRVRMPFGDPAACD
jgi:hypothetical protein